jgi:ABC-type transporter Mla MlaB component
MRRWIRSGRLARSHDRVRSSYNIVSQPHPADRSVTLLLTGTFSEDALPELATSIALARRGHTTVYLDLSEVTLVDRKAVQYLSAQAEESVLLINCPVHLVRWIHARSHDNH